MFVYAGKFLTFRSLALTLFSLSFLPCIVKQLSFSSAAPQQCCATVNMNIYSFRKSVNTILAFFLKKFTFFSFFLFIQFTFPILELVQIINLFRQEESTPIGDYFHDNGTARLFGKISEAADGFEVDTERMKAQCDEMCAKIKELKAFVASVEKKELKKAVAEEVRNFSAGI